MTGKKLHYIHTSYLRTNLQYGGLGVVIGLIVSAIRSAFANYLIPGRDILLNIMFSVLITLSITNSIYILEKFYKPEKVSLWKFIIIYYGCNIIGMLVGIEIAYMIISLIYWFPYVPFVNINDYKFSFIIVLVVGTVTYLYRAQQATLNARLKEKELDVTRLKQLKTQAELQMLQSKINPHFLYNSLNSIASLIHEDADRAEDMTLKLSKLFRYSINSQQENMASVKEEMEIVNTYLDIEKVRFGERINFETHVDAEMAKVNIPRFLIQPLVENALKHGLSNKADNGNLKLSIMPEAGHVAIVIADNGKPFPEELSIGYGLQSTYDKLNLLYGDNYQVQIANAPVKQIKIIIPVTL
jgi:two-component system LytT family sensor kinase